MTAADPLGRFVEVMPGSLLCCKDIAVLSLTPSPVYTVVDGMVPTAFPPIIALRKSWLCQHPILLFTVLCVCVTCVRAYVHACTCTRRVEVNLGCCSCRSPPCLFDTGSPSLVWGLLI